MKLMCKCGKELTKDLCKTKYNLERVETGEEGLYDFKYHPGFFTEHKEELPVSNKWSDNHPAKIWKGLPKRIKVSECDTLAPIPKMPSGYGCCNWSMDTDLRCECGKVVGWMFLDCWETGFIAFLENNVIRKY